MKKTVAILIVLCLVGAAALGFSFGREGKLAVPTAAAASPAATPTPVEVEALDYDALYALHEPDEVVMTIGGIDVSWGEYYYYLSRQSQSVENYFRTMAAYGMPLHWNDVAEGEDTTYADIALESATETARSMTGVEGFAGQNGVELTEEGRAQIEEKVASDIAATCGEEGTREDLEAYLASIRLPAALYDRMNELSVLLQQGFSALYGENGEKLPDEEALAYLDEAGYLSANHILFMTIDPGTRESLDEETVAAKKAQAEEVAAELRAIEDPEERLARFLELKQELDEDTGKTAYPEGYVFLPGEMVPEFEEAAKTQEVYQIVDPVETAYGYHIIMALPIGPETVMEYSSGGTPMTARSVAANAAYSEALDAYTLGQELVTAEGFDFPVLTDFILK